MLHYLIFLFILSHASFSEECFSCSEQSDHSVQENLSSDVSSEPGGSGSVNFNFNDQSIEDMLSNGGVISSDNPSGNNYFINVDYSYVDNDVTNNQQTEFNNSTISASNGGYVGLGSLSNSMGMGQESGGTGVFSSFSNNTWFRSS